MKLFFAINKYLSTNIAIKDKFVLNYSNLLFSKAPTKNYPVFEDWYLRQVYIMLQLIKFVIFFFALEHAIDDYTGVCKNMHCFSYKL